MQLVFETVSWSQHKSFIFWKVKELLTLIADYHYSFEDLSPLGKQTGSLKEVDVKY